VYELINGSSVSVPPFEDPLLLRNKRNKIVIPTDNKIRYFVKYPLNPLAYHPIECIIAQKMGKNII
jgi:hypothetical protein